MLYFPLQPMTLFSPRVAAFISGEGFQELETEPSDLETFEPGIKVITS